MSGMRAGTPDTALKAVAWRYLLVSRWPWRSAGYLFATLPAAAVAAAGLAIPAVPWLVLAGGGYQPGVIVALILLGAALIAALGPLIAIPATALGQWRLRMADTRPLGDRPRTAPAGPGPAAWLRARYTDPASWREVGYLCLLATVVPALAAAALLSALISVALIASPFVVLAQKPGGTPVTLVWPGSDRGAGGAVRDCRRAAAPSRPVPDHAGRRAPTRRWPARCCSPGRPRTCAPS